MEQDIQSCSVQSLKSIFYSLNDFQDYVFWIRNYDMSKQIYVSPNYQILWGAEPALLFDIPLIWLDYLAKQNKNAYMQQLQLRHTEHYFEHASNLVFYQITTPTGETRYIRDRAFKFQTRTGKQFIAGVAKSQSPLIWYSNNQLERQDTEDGIKIIYKKFFTLLKVNFGFTLLTQPKEKDAFAREYQQFLGKNEQFSFSKREVECLRLLCTGKTNKQAAQLMSISPRTVETYLESIRAKANCSNKIEVISRFSQYFGGF